jgi:hypothetical protein
MGGTDRDRSGRAPDPTEPFGGRREVNEERDSEKGKESEETRG